MVWTHEADKPTRHSAPKLAQAVTSIDAHGVFGACLATVKCLAPVECTDMLQWKLLSRPNGAGRLEIAAESGSSSWPAARVRPAWTSRAVAVSAITENGPTREQ